MISQFHPDVQHKDIEFVSEQKILSLTSCLFRTFTLILRMSSIGWIIWAKLKRPEYLQYSRFCNVLSKLWVHTTYLLGSGAKTKGAWWQPPPYPLLWRLALPPPKVKCCCCFLLFYFLFFFSFLFFSFLFFSFLFFSFLFFSFLFFSFLFFSFLFFSFLFFSFLFCFH